MQNMWISVALIVAVIIVGIIAGKRLSTPGPQRRAVYFAFGTRTGNTLGTVTAFDFDPVFGAIKSITLDNGSEFKSDAFLFFAPDFVFVDDGSKSAADLRQAEDNASDAPAAAPASTPATQPAPAAQPAAPAANADGLSNEDALLVDFLIGKTLNDDVANADDTFALPKGTEITREIALDAKKHDALLLLTMSVD